jgi:CheY-like chemotaxis protein
VTRAPVSGTLPLFNARILVVDDNPVNQEIAERTLELMEVQITIASNGAEAVDVTARETFDLVLMDCEMPVMDGYEATRRIRDREREQGGAPSLPIIGLTADVVQSNWRRAGMNDCLGKPFFLPQLAALLERWLPAHCRVANP